MKFDCHCHCHNGMCVEEVNVMMTRLAPFENCSQLINRVWIDIRLLLLLLFIYLFFIYIILFN